MRTIVSFAAILMLAACSKNADTTKPTITVTSPQANQVFNNGQTVTITASITDERELHGVHVTVTDQSNGGHVIHEDYHPDTKTYTVNESFQALAGRTYNIEIGAKDHNENHEMVTVKVSGQ